MKGIPCIARLLFASVVFFGGGLIGNAEENGGVKFQKAVLYGGSGNQRGTAISYHNASDVYLSGVDETLLRGQSIGLHYTLSSKDGSPQLEWTAYWPHVANGSGNVNSEVFDSVVGTRGGVFFAGRSWSQTEDGFGGKEHKSVLVKFPLTGATGSSVGGAEWLAKPNFFTYRGNESFLAVTYGPDRSGASHYIYASGYAQANGANNAAVLAQYDGSGTLRWSRVLGNTGWFMSSFGSAATNLNGYVYVAGMTHYPYTDSNAMKIALWKYDDVGNLIWVRSHPGFIPGWRGAMALVSSKRYQSTAVDLYVVGTIKNGPNGGMDGVILKYDESGNLLWSKTWGGPADDQAYGVTVNDHARTAPENQRLYVVGTTSSFGVGKQDAFLLELNPADGSIFSTHYYGGRENDVAWAVQRVGSYLYAVGDSKSFSEGGNVEGQSDLMLLQYAIQPTQAPLSVPIDIKPGSLENPINPKSPGKIPVAILSTNRFKAPEVVKQSTLTFGRLGTEQSLVFCKPEDVNADGRLDLVCHFESQRTAFQTGDTQGILEGLTISGIPLKGADSIRIVPMR
ncbi:MAG: hypothetical protein HYT88_05575 [Candidatus Omnitrophica bacterium]|nr:hypothetical protein [Candidatus Omnitrophota bacterium]MBI2174863.1 hypothetical protein [Candidatus Omnitrophota bacterium]